jgi:multicomponent Na+:H+ antiporter subunit D
MNAAMAVAAVLCLFIGCYTPYLYGMLPYPVTYHPYSAYHVSETLQLLLFTAVGFFLLIRKLAPEATISLDLDWFYRKGGKAFLWIARKPAQAIDGALGMVYRVAGLVPMMGSARLLGRFDNRVIDGGVDGLASAVRGLGRGLRRAQRGAVQESLALLFLIVLVVILTMLLTS